MAGYAQRPKGPQPVLDSLVEPDIAEGSDTASERHVRPAPPSRTQSPFTVHRSTRSNTHIDRDAVNSNDQTTSSTASLKPRPGLLRAKSDFGPRGSQREELAKASDDDGRSTTTDGDWGIRHGFDMQLASEEYNNQLNSNFFLYFTDKKHETGGVPKPESEVYKLQEWRMKERLKTVSAVLAMCLNIGVDPPDVIKTNPCAKEECWIDPTTPGSQSSKAPLDNIGRKLQSQYEALSMRTRYKLALDPTIDDLKKHTSNLRKSARGERVLLHYNGHGVPKPTPSGELWVFNKHFTQYIPVSLFDLQTWLGAPSIFVFDCSDAALIINNFLKFAEKQNQAQMEQRRTDPNAEFMDFMDCIHLAACREKETLPTNPDLPADVFTACLTSPIEMAIRFFILQNPLRSDVVLGQEKKIPGRVSERRTPLGELNWIFTAITDTIAWNSLPKPLFKKLFRQDLMVAALFRNFLLAQRIMRAYRCHPVSYPEIPPTHDHPLWRSWDLAVEMVLSQLSSLQLAENKVINYEYQHSNFFAEQLTAFELYIASGAADHKTPEQLPVVLQVLLSQVHRLRALILLSKFLDRGPWAVNLALSIGIFPYVLKLLQSQAIELKPVMVFIWARILAVDQSPQADLLKDNGYQYFVQIMSPTTSLAATNMSEHRAMCAFILAMFCRDFHQGQVVCLSPDLIEACLRHLDDMQNPLLRQWVCLCLSQLWVDFPEAKWMAMRCMARERICELIVDPVAEVRAAALHALTTFLGIPDMTPQIVQMEESIASVVLVMTADGNTMVRKELAVFFSTFVSRYLQKFIVAAYEQLQEEKATVAKPSLTNGTDSLPRSRAGSINEANSVSPDTIFAAMWKHLLVMSVDPYPEIAESASVVVDAVYTAMIESPLAKYAIPLMENLTQTQPPPPSVSTPYLEVAPTEPLTPSSPTTPNKNDGYFTASIKRTASVAMSLKNYFGSTTNLQQMDTSPAGKPIRSASNLQVQSLASKNRTSGDWNLPPDVKDQHLTSAIYPTLRIPEPRRFRHRNSKEAPRIPLKSHFIEWSSEYFREPQMRPSEADEPGSTDYNQRLWRRNRNDKIINKTQSQKELAGSYPWDKPKAFFNNGTQPMKMCFHQFESHVVVTDDRDGVSIWDWKRQARMNRFSNNNPPKSKITEVRLINEDDQALLMTGSSDGVIKLYRNYETPRQTELVTSFRALTDLQPSNKAAGLVFDWQQSRGLILVAGDVRSIRIWNAGTEICTADLNARSGSPITSLTSDQVEGNLFMAGFGDGALRLYDQREKPATAMVRVWKEHRAWVTNVHLQRGGQRELVSACRNGEVKLWDLRMNSSLKTIRATRDTLRTLSVHEHAPIFAVGTDKHAVKIFSMMDAHETTSAGAAADGKSVVLEHRGPVTAALNARHPNGAFQRSPTLNYNFPTAGQHGHNQSINSINEALNLPLHIRPNNTNHTHNLSTSTNGTLNNGSSAINLLTNNASHANLGTLNSPPPDTTTHHHHSMKAVPAQAHLLSVFEPYSTLLNFGGIQRSSPIACTSFHPHRMMIAGVAVGDTHVNIFGCGKIGAASEKA